MQHGVSGLCFVASILFVLATKYVPTFAFHFCQYDSESLQKCTEVGGNCWPFKILQQVQFILQFITYFIVSVMKPR